MANEITLNATLTVYKPSIMAAAVSRGFQNKLFNMTSNYYIESVWLAPISTAGAVPLGNVTTPHWSYWCNLDLNNYFTIRNGASGADVCKLYPGEFAIFPWMDTGSPAPYVLANTAAVLFEYLIAGT
jgi:hypothetical protein